MVLVSRESDIHPSCEAVALSVNSKVHCVPGTYDCVVLSPRRISEGLGRISSWMSWGNPNCCHVMPTGRTYSVECQFQQLPALGDILSATKFSDLTVTELVSDLVAALCLYLTVSVFCAFQSSRLTQLANCC